MDGIVLILALILNPRAERRRRRLQESAEVENGQGSDRQSDDGPITPSTLSTTHGSDMHTDEKCTTDVDAERYQDDEKASQQSSNQTS